MDNKEIKNTKYRLFDDYKDKIKKDLKNLKVIYTDLDGTLFNDQGCIIKDYEGNFYFEVVKLFERIAKRNWDIVLVSGRSKQQLRYNSMLIGVKNYITELGCELVHNFGEKAYVTFDDKKYDYEITNCGKDLMNIIKILKEAFPNKIDSNLDWSVGRSFNALFFGDIDLGKANGILKDAGYEGLVLVDNGFSKIVKLNLDVERLRILNLMPEGVDKSSAIKLDKKLRSFKDENCIALGDSIEDLKMAPVVKYFFLMKDAVERDSDILASLYNFNNVFVTKYKMNRGWTEVMKYLVD
ncbi:MAG: HAD-IIB family hydrolase [Actinobacteria bacterium]|nr:HAD-IIB family hydrolase [Actinomycetota bacterium]MCL5072893.1 HAD-IIB family hydrolase [Actinomycetota bacterium]